MQKYIWNTRENCEKLVKLDLSGLFSFQSFFAFLIPRKLRMFAIHTHFSTLFHSFTLYHSFHILLGKLHFLGCRMGAGWGLGWALWLRAASPAPTRPPKKCTRENVKKVRRKMRNGCDNNVKKIMWECDNWKWIKIERKRKAVFHN